MLKNYFRKMQGGKRSPQRAPMHEIFWSAVGSFIGILSIYYIGNLQGLHLQDNLFLVGSFGASAVLLYAIPASPYAQPRNLIFGHILSAIVGVSCSIFLNEHIALAAASAVALSIIAMHVIRSLHPPGGATALIAVIGGDNIQQLGFSYVITPIGAGTFILLITALLINNISQYRRYPQYWL